MIPLGAAYLEEWYERRRRRVLLDLYASDERLRLYLVVLYKHTGYEYTAETQSKKMCIRVDPG